MKVTMHIAVHEAAHAVIAKVLGGYVEGITLVRTNGRDGACMVSWPDDGVDRTREKLLMAAAGPAASAIFKRCGQDIAILMHGLGDLRYMERLGSTDDSWFKDARKLCRTHWPIIRAVADAALAQRVLCEAEIESAIKEAA
ncbi:MAG: M50 family metallopeptidase [Rhodanobacter sp.]